MNVPGGNLLPLYQLAVLAIIQGITEFLPISSSGHLALVPRIVGWPDQGLMIDVAVHVGTLGAVVLYFWRDIRVILRDVLRLFGGRVEAGAVLALYLFVASLPVAAVGFYVKLYAVDILRSAAVIGWAFVGFGILLFLCDRFGLTVRRIEHIKLGDALVIGIAQAFAVIPGTSRAGATITAARLLGLERREAARFSMLLSIPAILGAGLLQGIELFESGNAGLQADALIAAALAFVFALITVVLMMGWLRRASFTPFVIYRVIAGIAILVWVYAG